MNSFFKKKQWLKVVSTLRYHVSLKWKSDFFSEFFLLRHLCGVRLREYCLRWRKFTTTRWSTVGLSAKLLMRGLSVGLEQLVLITNESGCTCFHLNGFSRPREPVQIYAAAAAFGRPAPRSSRADVSSTAANVRSSPVQTSKTSRGMDQGEHHQLSFGTCGGQFE